MTVILGVIMFTVVILSLVVVLMVARSKLVAGGEVNIVINDDADNTIQVPAGGTLLGALAARKIFIPSACGGKGSCGVCKVDVFDGGGAMLPTEPPHITRREAREGCRLSCQVKVKQDLRIGVPPEVFSVRQWRCKVRSNHNVATFIKELVLELPAGDEVPFRAGGYIQITCPTHTVNYKEFEIEDEFRQDWDRFNLWEIQSTVEEPVDRAYSMANYPEEKGIIMLNIRVAHPASSQPQGHASGKDVLLHLRSEAGRRSHHLRPLRRVLRQGHRSGNGLHRRRRRNGSHAFPHLRSVSPLEHPAQGQLLVWSSQPPRGLLHR